MKKDKKLKKEDAKASNKNSKEDKTELQNSNAIIQNKTPDIFLSNSFDVKKIIADDMFLLSDHSVGYMYILDTDKLDIDLEKWFKQLSFPIQIVKKIYNYNTEEYVDEKIRAAKELIYNKSNNPNNLLYEEYDELLDNFETHLKKEITKFKKQTITLLVITSFTDTVPFALTSKQQETLIQRNSEYLKKIEENVLSDIKKYAKKLNAIEIKNILMSYKEYLFLDYKKNELLFHSFDDLLVDFKKEISKNMQGDTNE